MEFQSWQNSQTWIQWNLSIKDLRVLDNLWNKDTALIRTLRVVPRVSVIERFHCTLSNLLQMNPSIMGNLSDSAWSKWHEFMHGQCQILCIAKCTCIFEFENLSALEFHSCFQNTYTWAIIQIPHAQCACGICIIHCACGIYKATQTYIIC